MGAEDPQLRSRGGWWEGAGLLPYGFHCLCKKNIDV